MGAALRTAPLYALLVSVSLQAQSTLPAGTWRIADAPTDLRNEISRADLIIVSLHSALRRELSRELAEGGSVVAAKSCHIDVQGIIQQIGRREGIAAGRTSDRLRNPLNRPRFWAAPLVEANAGRDARDVDGFAVDLGTAVGVLRPIAEQGLCNACHGTPTHVDRRVRTAINEQYPADRATGFRNGEIRGWFWVEIPKTAGG